MLWVQQDSQTSKTQQAKIWHRFLILQKDVGQNTACQQYNLKHISLEEQSKDHPAASQRTEEKEGNCASVPNVQTWLLWTKGRCGDTCWRLAQEPRQRGRLGPQGWHQRGSEAVSSWMCSAASKRRKKTLNVKMLGKKIKKMNLSSSLCSQDK